MATPSSNTTPPKSPPSRGGVDWPRLAHRIAVGLENNLKYPSWRLVLLPFKAVRFALLAALGRIDAAPGVSGGAPASVKTSQPAPTKSSSPAPSATGAATSPDPFAVERRMFSIGADPAQQSADGRRRFAVLSGGLLGRAFEALGDVRRLRPNDAAFAFDARPADVLIVESGVGEVCGPWAGLGHVGDAARWRELEALLTSARISGAFIAFVWTTSRATTPFLAALAARCDVEVDLCDARLPPERRVVPIALDLFQPDSAIEGDPRGRCAFAPLNGDDIAARPDWTVRHWPDSALQTIAIIANLDWVDVRALGDFGARLTAANEAIAVGARVVFGADVGSAPEALRPLMTAGPPSARSAAASVDDTWRALAFLVEHAEARNWLERLVADANGSTPRRFSHPGLRIVVPAASLADLKALARGASVLAGFGCEFAVAIGPDTPTRAVESFFLTVKPAKSPQVFVGSDLAEARALALRDAPTGGWTFELSASDTPDQLRRFAAAARLGDRWLVRAKRGDVPLGGLEGRLTRSLDRPALIPAAPTSAIAPIRERKEA